MKTILRMVMLPVFLFFFFFLSATAEITPLTNTAIGDSNLKFNWLGYAVQQANAIIDPNCRDDVYNWLGRAQAKAGDIEGANASASAISNLQNRIYVHIATATTAYKNGNVSGYKTSMEQAKSAALLKRRVESAIFANSAMITAYLDCQDVDGAKSYAETLRDNPEAPKGYHDVQLAYRAIATHLALNGNMEDADFIVDTHIQASGKDWALVEMAETCIREGNLGAAEQIAVRLTGPELKDRVKEKLGAAFAESGDTEKARSIAETISDLTRRSSVIAAIAKYQVKSGDIDLGEKTAMDITDRDHKIAVYTRIAEKRAELGEIDSAVETVEMMAKMIENAPRAPDVSKFGVFDDSFKRGAVQTVYLGAAKTSARNGDAESYNKFIAKAIEGVKEINDTPVWKDAVFIRIVDAQLEAGDIEGAKKTINEMKEEYNRSSGLYNIVIAQLKKGDIEGAVTTSKDIADTMNKSFAYGEIASAFVKRGELIEAQKVLLGLGNSSREAQAYHWTAMTFVEAGHMEELAKWLNDIPTPQARVYACIGAVNGIMKLADSKPSR